MGKNKGSATSSRRRQRSSALHLDFQICRSCFSKKKSTPNGVLFFLLLVYTLDIVYWSRYRSDLFHYLPLGKIIIVSNPSSRIRATVHRTVAFDGSNLSVLDFSKKKSTPLGVLFFLEVPARFELANESFADSCLTTWPRYHFIKTGTPSVPILFDWSG